MKKTGLLVCLITALCALSLTAETITVSIGAGTHWKSKSAPQFAVWLEDEDGTFVRTLYATPKTAKKTFSFCPKSGRPESLPVWYNASKTAVHLDAVSSATPKGGTVFQTELDGKKYVIKAEFNTSFDYNSFYTKKNAGVNGQPSVIYAGQFTAQEKLNEFSLNFAGTGSIDGKSGAIDKSNDATLTTAKEIISNIKVYVE